MLVSALFVLWDQQNADDTVAMLAFLPALVFWSLDGFFLLQERLYRDKHNEVRMLPPEDIDFSMATANPHVRGWISSTFSKTLIPFHGITVVAIVLVLAMR